MNALNMFDGINLQSTIYSLIIFTSIYLFFINSILTKILIIFLIGFFYLNYKNKSFLGDSGTLTLAFIIGYIFIRLYNLGLIQNADEIVIYMIIPGLDLIRLFIIRILKKRNPLSSDRLHLHHLIISKYDFKKTITIISLLIILPIVLNYFDLKNLYNLLIIICLYFLTIILVQKKA
jgi:UDP-GlcNAc:undecaprenyl-phosphate GlcNAc-1-phosphate transferase